jgi:hypothetical protein
LRRRDADPFSRLGLDFTVVHLGAATWRKSPKGNHGPKPRSLTRLLSVGVSCQAGNPLILKEIGGHEQNFRGGGKTGILANEYEGLSGGLCGINIHVSR